MLKVKNGDVFEQFDKDISAHTPPGAYVLCGIVMLGPKIAQFELQNPLL